MAERRRCRGVARRRWGVDALVGEETRAHTDCTLIVLDDHASQLRDSLSKHGFEHARGPDWNFVLRDDRGREVDVHPVRVDEEGNGHFTAEAGEPFVHPASAFTGTGTAEGRRAKCLSAEAQMVNHSEGYVPTDTDFHDMRLLNDRLGTPLLPPYRTGSPIDTVEVATLLRRGMRAALGRSKGKANRFAQRPTILAGLCQPWVVAKGVAPARRAGSRGLWLQLSSEAGNLAPLSRWSPSST